MKKQLLLLLMMFLPMVAWADAVEIDGIYYNLIPKGEAAEVTANPNKYNGDIDIPSGFVYEDIEYTVKTIANGAFSGSEGLKSVTIPVTVTSIGNYAFNGCTALETIEIPGCVTTIGEGVFWGCSGLKGVTMSNSVASIGNSAFYGCTSLSIFILPNSLATIESNTFSGCENLEHIVIPNSVKKIKSYAFSGCNKLSSVHITDLKAWCEMEFDDNGYPYRANPLYTAHHLFLNDEEIKDLVIPDNVTSISDRCFAGCTGLTSLTISDGVTSIGKQSFYECSGLTTVNIGNGVSVINTSSFAGCSSLKNVSIGEAATVIGQEAFKNCSSLSSIEFPDGLTTIENSAFKNCTSLINIDLPISINTIGESAFADCNNLTSISVSNNVTNIGSNAFEGCTSLKSFVIPSGLKMIRSSTFHNCTSLSSITIPNGIVMIYDSPFSNCVALKSINIPNSVSFVGSAVFSGCKNLKDIVIGKGINTIGNYAFSSCPELADVYCYAENVPNTQGDAFNESYIEYATLHVPAASIEAYKAKEPWSHFGTIEAITFEKGNCGEGVNYTYSETSKTLTISGEGAMYEYENYDNLPPWSDFRDQIETLVIEPGVTRIGRSAFNSCSALNNVTLNKGLISIGSHAFYNCKNLRSLDIPNTVTAIGTYTFYGSGLTSIVIPASVTSIGHNDSYDWPYGSSAFSACEDLASIVVSPDNTVFDSRNDCNAIIKTETNTLIEGCKKTVIPESVKEIGMNAFSGITGLTSINIPEGVENVSHMAFSGCSNLRYVSLPSTMKRIESYAFSYCNNLQEMRCYATTPPESYYTNVFNNSSVADATLKVPEEAIEAYKASNLWKLFKTIIAIPSGPRCATPTITYANGKLSFSCDTEDVEFVYEVSTADNKKGKGQEVELTKTYVVSVYATRDGYGDSDIATAEIDVRGTNGDANGDGVIDIADAVKIVNIVVGKE